MKQILVLACLIPLAACSSEPPREPDYEANAILSGAIKKITAGIVERGCTMNREWAAVQDINSVLQARNSTHRIVMWDLPKKCRGQE